MKKYLVFLSLFLLIPVLVLAQEDRSTLPALEVYDGNYFAYGPEVDIAGDVNGDLYVIGQTVTIRGNVSGDVMIIGMEVTITGSVGQDLRAAADRVTIDAPIGRNVALIGNKFDVKEDAAIAGDLVAGGVSLFLNGPVGGALEGTLGQATLASSIGRNVNLKLIDLENNSLLILSSANIGGDLNYWSTAEASIADEAQIVGNRNYNKIADKKLLSLNQYQDPLFYYVNVIYLLGLFVIGSFMSVLFRSQTMKIVKQIELDYVRRIWIGVAVFIAVPIIIFLLPFTIIGLPLALVLLALYVIALYVGVIYVAMFIGQRLMKIFKWKKIPAQWQLLLGLVIFVALKTLPVIGGFFYLIAVWIAFGALYQTYRLFRKSS